jgi:hypothetical protein
VNQYSFFDSMKKRGLRMVYIEPKNPVTLEQMESGVLYLGLGKKYSRSHAPAWERTRGAPRPIVAAGGTEMSPKMKQITENSRKRTGWVKVLGMGLGMALIFRGTPASADTGLDDADVWFSSRTQFARGEWGRL